MIQARKIGIAGSAILFAIFMHVTTSLSAIAQSVNLAERDGGQGNQAGHAAANAGADVLDVEIQINVPVGETTDNDLDDYISVTNAPGLPKTRCRAKLKKPSPMNQNMTVVISNKTGAVAADGVVRFPDEANEETAPLTLLADGTTWAEFWISGKKVSSVKDDCVIEAHKDTSSGGIVGKQELTVVKVDLEIYKPAVMGGAMIPDASEMTTGSVTFVNLDNDDSDNKFDYNPDGAGTHDDVVTDGDDELVKVKLKIKPNNLTVGQVKLLATAGAGHIAVWKESNKAAASTYDILSAPPFNVPSDLAVEGDFLVKNLWVEGISAHTVQKGTTLKMEYSVTGSTACDDEAALTIVGVDKVEWIGRTNSVSDSNILDPDPNWPAGLVPNAARVFPDSRTNGNLGPIARDTVDAKVTLSVAPPFEIMMYLNTFDVDDPTATNGPVDSPGAAANAIESTPDDNRGNTPDLGTVKTLTFPEGVAFTSCLFRVAMYPLYSVQPGDNFRAVVNGDSDFVTTAVLENDDTAQNTGANDAERNANKQRIVCKAIGAGGATPATPDQKEVRLSPKYASDTLVVWRFLNIEVDSMGSVTDNEYNGHINGFVGAVATAATELLTESLDDGSLNLGPPDWGNGRFENGSITLGAGINVTISGSISNRPNAVVFPPTAIVPLEFDAKDIGGYWGYEFMFGTITQITPSGGQYVLAISPTFTSETPIDLTDYVGGEVRIGGAGGTWVTIDAASPGALTVATLDIPYYNLKDDDQIQSGQDVPAPDVSGIAPIWSAAYIMPRFNPSWNTPNAPFRLNTHNTGTSGDELDTDLTNSKDIPWSAEAFWAVTVKNGYQTAAARGGFELLGDNDPNTDSTVRAWGSWKRQGAILMEESIRDWIAAPSNGPPVGPIPGYEMPVGFVYGGGGVDPDPRGDAGRQARRNEILNHEIAHTFKLDHDDGQPSVAQRVNGDVMSAGPERGASVFGGQSLHKLRTKKRPGSGP